MKQMIILLSMIILGIAISVMVMSFEGTSQDLTDSAHNKMKTTLEYN
ncbi:MAG: hypothetical protein LBN22_03245 [Clostridiales Family XIII bacterium]|jgi:hypothetical protein|nr:hypothetical protein [Clostridiales Family XIII bacterium]